MVFSKILNIATSLFYFTNTYNGDSLRKKNKQALAHYPPSNFGVATDYIPLNERDTFFISYHNNIRKDVRYKNGKFEDMTTV